MLPSRTVANYSTLQSLPQTFEDDAVPCACVLVAYVKWQKASACIRLGSVAQSHGYWFQLLPTSVFHVT